MAIQCGRQQQNIRRSSYKLPACKKNLGFLDEFPQTSPISNIKDGRTDKTKVTDAFRDFSNLPNQHIFVYVVNITATDVGKQKALVSVKETA